MNRVAVLWVLFCLSGCVEEEELGRFESHTGSTAKSLILNSATRVGHRSSSADVRLPSSATDFYFSEEGAFSGSTIYWSMRCDSVDECWKVVEAFGGPARSEFVEWHASDYAVVMDGPGFYGEATTLWNVRLVERGTVHESVTGPPEYKQNMEYWAIDFDRRRIFYHDEIGGFDPERAK